MTPSSEFFHEFQGPNAAYVLEQYERYLLDPSQVDESWRVLFAQWQPVMNPVEALSGIVTSLAAPLREEVSAASEKTIHSINNVSDALLDKAVAVANLAQAIRSYGHLASHLDPLGSPPPGDASVNPVSYGLSEIDLRGLPARLVTPVAHSHYRPAAGSASDVKKDLSSVEEHALSAIEGRTLTAVAQPVPTMDQSVLLPDGSAYSAIQALQTVYTGSIGYDYGHVVDPQERVWLRETAENGLFRDLLTPERARQLLERLTRVEGFERFLQRIYPGKTRFSIEGVDMLVPVLDEIISAAADDGICMVFLGMAHRGRLNVLAHILKKPYDQILAEFKDPGSDASAWHELGWTGDVKYHAGAARAVPEGLTVRLIISMPPNPSHLEYVDPVLQGMARAADTAMDHAGPPVFFPKASLPILIHGDASFPGQGVVAETLNMSQLSGYYTAGTVHIITNNQLGYTASTAESRSSLYASDMAKGLKIPVMHVNADDPQACLVAAWTAYAYRVRFQKDFVIDMVGYRRYGHNEGDEPGFTQPLMYAEIDSHPTVRKLWADHLVEVGLVDKELPEQLLAQVFAELQAVEDSLKAEESIHEPVPVPPPPGAARHVTTAVPLERLKALNTSLLQTPQGFHINRKLERSRRRQTQIFEDTGGPASGIETASIDWAAAEALALASILEDGVAVRFTGQDTQRGTFSQRHAVLHDVATGATFTPLQALPQAHASCEIINSPLNENAAVGFEFGYNIQGRDRLVIWEAQYGDFANGAQVMIDEFVTSARSKWGLTPSLVLLLPHGNEGQGPDHTSGRPERFLRLAAETNLRIAYPTTAAQYFHLLRRQVALLKTDPLPLVVMTPKGLLRHPLTASRPVELVQGGWQPVINETMGDPAQVRRLVFCSGRVWVDLMTGRERLKAAQVDSRDQPEEVALARLEQLYPTPAAEMKAVLDCYPNIEQVLWVQEEPQNMGAWGHIHPYLAELIQGRWPLDYVGRLPSSSPAEGSATFYALNQRILIEQVFNPQKQPEPSGILVERG
jgi:2-oxoglutarate dehydrogenase E1 component